MACILHTLSVSCFVSRNPLQGKAWILQTLSILFSSVQFSQFNSVQLFISKNPLQQEACILRCSRSSSRSSSSRSSSSSSSRSSSSSSNRSRSRSSSQREACILQTATPIEDNACTQRGPSSDASSGNLRKHTSRAMGQELQFPSGFFLFSEKCQKPNIGFS